MHPKNEFSRRRFLKSSLAATVGASILPSKALAGPPDPSRSATGTFGLAMVSSREGGRSRVDLVSLKDSRVLTTWHDFHAAHAVVPVEGLNRFFVHGVDTRTDQGLLMGVEVDPLTEHWRVLDAKEVAGGRPLHWQPNRAHTLIQYNTIGDKRLHVLDTRTLELESFEGGGRHSNMAFFNQDRWLVATDRLRGATTLRVVDRASGQILSETPAGDWGHGVTVNDKTERAFVWANDGVHIVGLGKGTLGQHLGVLKPGIRGQRSWFCWTPQGQRFSHDQTWNPGDHFASWLTVVDMENDELLRIEAGEQLGTLGISPDGSLGLCGSHSSNNVCLFDIPGNR
ncbi:MAG: hypothetical protein AAF657_38225, partial [Acidobacteriota bacterium]